MMDPKRKQPTPSEAAMKRQRFTLPIQRYRNQPNFEIPVDVAIPVGGEEEVDPLRIDTPDQKDYATCHENGFPNHSMNAVVKSEEIDIPIEYPDSSQVSPVATILRVTEAVPPKFDALVKVEELSDADDEFAIKIEEKPVIPCDEFEIKIEEEPVIPYVGASDGSTVPIKTNLAVENKLSEERSSGNKLDKALFEASSSESTKSASECDEPDIVSYDAAVLPVEDSMRGHSTTMTPSTPFLDPQTGLFVTAYDSSVDMPEESNDFILKDLDYDAPDPLGEEKFSTYNQPSCSTICSVNSLLPPVLDSPVPVNMLLAHPLEEGHYWTAEEKNDILLQPPPLSTCFLKKRDPLKISSKVPVDLRDFPWLCDSPETGRFYCWPCLLCASRAKSLWSIESSEFGSKLFEEAVNAHQTSFPHLHCQTTYYSKKDVALATHVKLDVGDCINLWELFVRIICIEYRDNNTLAENDLILTCRLQEIITKLLQISMPVNELLALSKNVLNIATLHLRSAIMNDVKNAQYVVLHLEELPVTGSDGSWIAVIARYSNEQSQIVEGIIEFEEVSPSETYRIAPVAIKRIQHLFTSYGLGENVVGFSYSASIVLPKETDKFHTLIRKWCPRATFFHSICDNLLKSMVQVISHDPECRKYFQGAQELCMFMNQNQSLIASLEKIAGGLPTLPKTFNSYFATNLSSYYTKLLPIFQAMVYRPQCNRDVRQNAEKFVRFLESPPNRVIMTLVGKLAHEIKFLAAAVKKRHALTLVKRELRAAIRRLIELRGCVYTYVPITPDPVLCQYIARNSYFVGNIISLVTDMLRNRFRNLDPFEYTYPDFLKTTPLESRFFTVPDSILKGAGMSTEELRQLSSLMVSPSLPSLFKTGNLKEILHGLVLGNKTEEYPALHKYLLYIHTLSFIKTAQQPLLKSLQHFIQKRLPPRERPTKEFMYGFFWQNDDYVSRILQGSKMFAEALVLCKLRIIVVRNSANGARAKLVQTQ